MSPRRREFLKQASALSLGAVAATALPPAVLARAALRSGTRPIVISSANGIHALDKAMEVIHAGGDALDAVIAAVNVVEDDPNDTSVGYGGLPNEDGIVELDAAVMHGASHRAGAVAALRNIRNPSKVARLVMERTDHVLLVGEGALRFARAHGFREEDLLTDKAREAWLEWKEHLSNSDDWLPPHTENDKDIGVLLPAHLQSEFAPFFRSTGTVHCSAIDLKGNISCVTSTSGLAFKIPGRVGDSPIVGAGLYVDNQVGSAGSTGRGEATLSNCGSGIVVEFMRQGKTPEQACLDVCQRIVDHTRMRRLKDDSGRPNFNVLFYALSRNGEYGSAAIFSGKEFAVHDGTHAKLLPAAYLYKK